MVVFVLESSLDIRARLVNLADIVNSSDFLIKFEVPNDCGVLHVDLDCVVF